jgi:hypothetical protein
MAELSAQEELKIFENILAQSKMGLNDPELIGKFSQAKSQYHAMQSMEAVNAQNYPPQSVNMPMNQNNSPRAMPSAPLGGGGLPQAQESPVEENNATEGQGTLNLPQ